MRANRRVSRNVVKETPGNGTAVADNAAFHLLANIRSGAAPRVAGHLSSRHAEMGVED